jgi:hypothetical protein
MHVLDISKTCQILVVLIFFRCRLHEGNSFEGVIRASKEDYEQLPPYMKSLASWEV